TLTAQGVEWVQIDEPILVTELDAEWRRAFRTAYAALETRRIKLLLATYFGQLQDNLTLRELPPERVLSIGAINGRNIWKTDLNATLDWLEPRAAPLEPVERDRHRQRDGQCRAADHESHPGVAHAFSGMRGRSGAPA
ncbi:hypothetical protein QM306_39625, partial [Burkholderia cenocepacia]|nr:hypothetical protein [Burkholderia cenocepacia]